MTYHVAIPSSASSTAREPHIECDGCGVHFSCLKMNGLPCAWAVSNQAPPGWRLVRVEVENRLVGRKDWCKACKKHMVPAELNLVRITGLYLGAAPNGFDQEWARLDGDWQKYFVRKGWRVERCPVAHPFSTGCKTCAPYHGAIAVKVGA